MSTVWESLSRNQKAAVLHETGAAVVFAGPGSGKTRVVTLRAARLATQGQRLLVTTFTNDAAQEMRHRLERLLDKAQTKRVQVSTLHALCLQILRQHGRKAQLLTDESLRRNLAESAQASELEGGTLKFLTRLSYQKNLGFSAQTYQHDESFEDSEFARVWKEYEKRKIEKGFAEFDDLLLETKSLLEGNESLRLSLAGRYDQIIVDECQDMNAPQYDIVFLLGREHGNLMLVGDMDQSLYGFRGADSGRFRRFAEHPRSTVHELRENYRSVRSVISFADSLIRQDTERRVLVFVPTREEGAPVFWDRYPDAEVEALAVGERILQLMAQGAKAKEIAVLYRANAQSEAFERHFAALGIPYTLREEGDFYARKEIGGLLAYLQFFFGSMNSLDAQETETHANEWLLALLNVPNRKLSRDLGAELSVYGEIRGRKIWEVLTEYHAPTLHAQKALRYLAEDLKRIETKLPTIAHAGDAIRHIRSATQFDDWLRKFEADDRDNDRLQNVQRMQSAAERYPTVPEYLRAVQRVRDEAARRKAERAQKRREQDAVALSTGHAAKGLEWRFVFGVGWSEEILPHRKAEDMAEERRIAYVMATRARDRLFLSSLETWNDATTSPSRFLTGCNLVPASNEESSETPKIESETTEVEMGGLFMTL